MPFVNTRVNTRLDAKKIDEIKSEIGKLIQILPGKSEQWLMTEVDENCSLYFQGSKEPCAYIEVKVYGRPNPQAYERFTEKVTETVSRIAGIRPDRIYVSYFETPSWGYAGANF